MIELSIPAAGICGIILFGTGLIIGALCMEIADYIKRKSDQIIEKRIEAMVVGGYSKIRPAVNEVLSKEQGAEPAKPKYTLPVPPGVEDDVPEEEDIQERNKRLGIEREPGFY